ncbi:MAG: hypothetical protein MdMp014T_2734 [Treponematales bacterium]
MKVHAPPRFLHGPAGLAHKAFESPAVNRPDEFVPEDVPAFRDSARQVGDMGDCPQDVHGLDGFQFIFIIAIIEPPSMREKIDSVPPGGGRLRDKSKTRRYRGKPPDTAGREKRKSERDG